MSTGTGGTNLTWHEGEVTREDRHKLLQQKGAIVWMTGLSAAGKSTIAVELEKLLLERHKHAYRLDGDNIRMGLNKGLGFSAEDRAENIRRIGEVAKLFADSGTIAITSFISPYKKDRDAVRAGSKPGDFIEVYVQVSLEGAEKRDPKGLYKKARAGEIKGFTGIDDPYEAPEKPEILIATEKLAVRQAAEAIYKYLESGGYLSVPERKRKTNDKSRM